MNLSMLPGEKKIITNSISDGYGASYIAKKYINLEKNFFARNFCWQHGWIPDLWNIDRDEIIGEMYSKKFKSVFVARKSQQDYLANLGINAIAIGLPFCYVEPTKFIRKKNSLF